MVSFTLLSTLTAGALPLVAADASKDGSEWRFLMQFLDSVKSSADAASLRSSTYWNPAKARNFPGDVLKGLPESDECEVVMYYPNMKQRGKDMLAGKHIADTYGVPFAIAPLCGGNASVTANNPTYPTSPDTVVFHQLFPNPGFEDDVYVRLRPYYISKHKERLAMWDFHPIEYRDGDTIIIAGGKKAQDAISEAFNKDYNQDKFETYPPVSDMVNKYVGKYHESILPNPYFYGKGDKIWADYTGLNTFWGYNEDGTCNTTAPKEQ